VKGFTRNLVWLGAILGAIGVLLYLFVFDTWVVPEGDPQLALSVDPLLRPTDRVLTKRGGTPRFAQLARCQNPDGSGRYVVGRAFGFPGDQVQLRDERVVINGKGIATRFACGEKTMPHPVSGNPTTLTCSTEDNGTSTYQVLLYPAMREIDRAAHVSAGKIYLVSDNRHFHQDSRDFGEVDGATCEAVVFRLWGDSFVDASRRFNILW